MINMTIIIILTDFGQYLYYTPYIYGIGQWLSFGKMKHSEQFIVYLQISFYLNVFEISYYVSSYEAENEILFFNVKMSKLTDYFLHHKNSQNF